MNIPIVSFGFWDFFNGDLSLKSYKLEILHDIEIFYVFVWASIYKSKTYTLFTINIFDLCGKRTFSSRCFPSPSATAIWQGTNMNFR